MTKLSFPHSTAYRFPTKKSTLKGFITLLPVLSLFWSACQKPKIKDDIQPSKLSTMSDRVTSGIQFSDIMAKLPQTVMYELGDSVRFYTGKYESLKTDSTLAVRIPTTLDGNHYLYAVRSFNNPADLKVYLVQFIPDRGSVPERYTGQQIWLDVQDWHIYGTTYKNNIPTQQLKPIQLAEPGWEDCMIENGYFSIGDNGNLLVSDNPTVMGGDCHDPIKPQSPSFFKNLTNTIKDFLSGEGGSNNNNWGPGFSVVWNNCGGGAGGPAAAGGSGGGGSNTFTPGTLENGPHSLEGNGIPESGNSGITQNTNTAAAYVFYFLSQSGYPLTQPEVNWLVFHNNTDATKMQQYILGPTQGFTLQEKAVIIKEHISMMVSNQDYANEINNLPGNWWDLDQDGFMVARKIEMKLYLQANPNGMLDCNNMNLIPSNMTQEVGSYQVPQSVLDRINTIRNQHLDELNGSNFVIQQIDNALGGTVNCDYFWVKFNTLPYHDGSNQYSAFEFLEHFRTHINDYISQNVGVSFHPYIQHPTSFNPNLPPFIDETGILNSPYESSLGAIIHIEMPNNGSVIETGYNRNNVTNHYHFTFTTMTTPIDGTHPVAGNRRFGIFKSNGFYYFYILGVDRTFDWQTTLANLVGKIAFNGADQLWHSVQQNVRNQCSSWSSTSIGEVIARPDWEGPVKLFLKGLITFQQLKVALHCP